MQRYFSPSANDGRGGFFSEDLHGPRMIEAEQTKREIAAGKRPELVPNPACRIPEDAQPISAERHAELMAAQAEGKEIGSAGGKPVARERKLSAEELEAIRRRERDRLLAASDWTQLGDASPAGGKAAWAAYRQQLRDLAMDGEDWPEQPGAGA